MACRAEVEQDRAAVRADVNIVRLDVAVDEPCVVYQFQPVQNRQQDSHQLRFRHRLAPFEQCRERLAFLETHHHVGGIVELEHRVHTNNVRMVKLGERTRFADEALQPPAIALVLFLSS